MWKTILALIISLILIPFVAFYFDDPPSNKQNDILYILVYVYVIAALFTYIVSSLSSNYSQVDKIWSLIPIVYSWIVAWHGNFEPRILLMSVLVTLWGIRLTYNFARRGGYSWQFWKGEEDYRWSVLKSKKEFKGAGRWTLFNFFFISFYQMGLILLFTLPILRSVEGKSIGFWDYLLATLFIAFLLFESVADQQQWNYHKSKKKAIKENAEVETKYQRGFVKEGLWSRMRHPNYAAEQGIWIIFYLFSVAATGQWLNWSIMGAILLMLLFWKSSDFSEEISASKYPEYKDYIKSTGRFFPKIF